MFFELCWCLLQFKDVENIRILWYRPGETVRHQAISTPSSFLILWNYSPRSGNLLSCVSSPSSREGDRRHNYFEKIQLLNSEHWSDYGLGTPNIESGSMGEPRDKTWTVQMKENVLKIVRNFSTLIETFLLQRMRMAVSEFAGFWKSKKVIFSAVVVMKASSSKANYFPLLRKTWATQVESLEKQR